MLDILNGFVINLISIIPTAWLAIKVEKHYTQFWTAMWNMFALAATGLSMLIVPYNNYAPFVTINNVNVPFQWIFLPYALIVAYIGIYHEANALRYLGGSKITTSFLLVGLFAQFLKITDVVVSGVIFALAFVALIIAQKYL